MRELQAMAMFGLCDGNSRQFTIIPRCTIDIPLPGIVFITGASGAGKSTLLRLIAQDCAKRGARAIRFDDLPRLDDANRPLVDLVGDSVETAMSLLSLAGLGEASVMLRRPGELSDGQRYRLSLARVMELAGQAEDASDCVIVADEFGAVLDRLTAEIVARNVRRWVDRPDAAPIAFIAASGHDDLLEALQPDALIWISPGGDLRISTRERRTGHGESDARSS